MPRLLYLMSVEQKRRRMEVMEILRDPTKPLPNLPQNLWREHQKAGPAIKGAAPPARLTSAELAKVVSNAPTKGVSCRDNKGTPTPVSLAAIKKAIEFSQKLPLAPRTQAAKNDFPHTFNNGRSNLIEVDVPAGACSERINGQANLVEFPVANKLATLKFRRLEQ
uniref:Uncharacterized protein n=1 Tax=Mycena chlorophos TaxID=658473 RepID=A0ABQ0L2V0_MYCCL|nr:predicted protein [Mycena chlorophos]